MKKVVTTFGRMNPPTSGHQKLVDKITSLAKGADARIYLSHSQNNKKDPLDYNTKIALAQKAFGSSVIKSNAKTIIQVMQELQKAGYTDVTIVVGSDRVKDFDTLLNKYNGKDYTFDSIKVVSAGQRDPDADDVSGMSASKLRALAKEGNFAAFKTGLPRNLQSSAKKIYDQLRSIMEQPETEEQLDEYAVLNQQQRLKRGRMMKRIAKKVARMRKIRAKRMADTNRLMKRSRKQAIQFLRKRVAGERGREYRELGRGEKITIDKLVQKKSAMIDRLAKRLLPKVRKAEIARVAAARAPKNEEYLREEVAPVKSFKDLMERRKGPNEIRALNDINQEKRNDFVKHDRMRDQARLKDTLLRNRGITKEAYESLEKKAEAINVSIDTVLEVYDAAEVDSSKSATEQQQRFAAVNHFVAEARKSGLEGACWKGYEAIGTKKKNGKTVPNCVPSNEEVDPYKNKSGRMTKRAWDFVPKKSATPRPPLRTAKEIADMVGIKLNQFGGLATKYPDMPKPVSGITSYVKGRSTTYYEPKAFLKWAKSKKIGKFAEINENTSDKLDEISISQAARYLLKRNVQTRSAARSGPPKPADAITKKTPEVIQKNTANAEKRVFGPDSPVPNPRLREETQLDEIVPALATAARIISTAGKAIKTGVKAIGKGAVSRGSVGTMALEPKDTATSTSDVPKLSEISPQTLIKYASKAASDSAAARKAGDIERAKKREAGISRAMDKEVASRTAPKPVKKPDDFEKKERTPLGEDGYRWQDFSDAERSTLTKRMDSLGFRQIKNPDTFNAIDVAQRKKLADILRAKPKPTSAADLEPQPRVTPAEIKDQPSTGVKVMKPVKEEFDKMLEDADRTIDRLRWADVPQMEPLKRMSNNQLKGYVRDYVSKNSDQVRKFMGAADSGMFGRAIIQKMAPNYIPATKSMTDKDWSNAWKAYDNIDPKIKSNIKKGDVSDFQTNSYVKENKAKEISHKNHKKKMLKDILPKSGAGAWGTDELANNYRNQTPGQSVSEETQLDEIGGLLGLAARGASIGAKKLAKKVDGGDLGKVDADKLARQKELAQKKAQAARPEVQKAAQDAARRSEAQKASEADRLERARANQASRGLKGVQDKLDAKNRKDFNFDKDPQGAIDKVTDLSKNPKVDPDVRPMYKDMAKKMAHDHAVKSSEAGKRLDALKGVAKPEHKGTTAAPSSSPQSQMGVTRKKFREILNNPQHPRHGEATKLKTEETQLDEIGPLVGLAARGAANLASKGLNKLSKSDWWNKGRDVRVPGENKASWKDLAKDDISQMTRSDAALKAGDTSASSLRPFKAFTPDMVKTGPTPAVRQAVERPLKSVSNLMNGYCPDTGELIESLIIEEAEHEGKKVKLNNPFRLPSGSKKKFGVYVKNDKGNVVKVTFGDPNMEIKRDDPERRKAFRSRHSCDDDIGPKWKARYWSCRQWRAGHKVDD